MKINTTFSKREDLYEKLSTGIIDIDSIYSKINFILHEDLYPLKKDSYHFIGQLLKKIAPTNRSTRAWASTLFKACYQAELLSAGAANIGFLLGLSLAREIIKTPLDKENIQEVLASFESLLECLKKQIENNSTRSSESDIVDIINRSCENDQMLASVVWEAVNLAGLEGRIFVENGRQENYLVELKEGYTFRLNPFKFMLQNNEWDRRNCKVLIVDGLVEKVSELDHLLTKSLETQVPMVIIAHGFSEEVAATLKANQECGLLDIQPVRIPSDVDNLNVVNDIATTCGCLPVSSMKGDLIVFTKYEELPTIDRIRLHTSECVIENSKTRAAVAAQTRAILEKRQSYFLHEEVQELFDKRLRSLVSNSVVIYLPNSSSTKNDERRVKIDISLRQCKTILNYGTVNLLHEIQTLKDTLRFSQNSKNSIERFFLRVLDQFCEKLERENVTKVPTISALSGIMLAGKAMLLLMTSSGFVEITEP